MRRQLQYMRLVLKLAEKGEGKVFPNPKVGAVIVKDDKVVGMGYHQYFGGPHAEINALTDAGQNARGADMYVNLEPCAHFGKTPPCTTAILEAGIKKLYIAMEDPNSLVKGKGIRELNAHRVKAQIGCLENEAKELNSDYIHYLKFNRPYVILKWAMSIDGKIATHTGDAKWISNPAALKFAHHLRGKVGAIVVGINTVIKDNPLLTVRGMKISNKPVRIVLDRTLRIPLRSKILNKDAKTIIACDSKADLNKAKILMEKGIEVWQVKNLPQLLQKLTNRGISKVLVEGGGQIHAAFIEQKLADKVLAVISPIVIGGEKAITPVAGLGIDKLKNALHLHNIKFKQLDDNVLMEGDF